MTENFSNIPVCKNNKKSGNTSGPKPVEFSNILTPSALLVLPKLSKEKLSKSKYHGKNGYRSQNQVNNSVQLTYAQASSMNINNILKIKNNFPNLLNRKVKEINRTITNSNKTKLRINMTTKDSSCKQIIILIGNNHIIEFMKIAGEYISNLNCTLRGIKPNTIIHFIHINHCSLIIIASKVTSSLNLNMVENYIKTFNFVDASDI